MIRVIGLDTRKQIRRLRLWARLFGILKPFSITDHFILTTQRTLDLSPLKMLTTRCELGLSGEFIPAGTSGIGVFKSSHGRSSIVGRLSGAVFAKKVLPGTNL